MTNNTRYVVTLYTRSHTVKGVYGPFADAEAAHVFGRVANVPRYRVSTLQRPAKFLFEESEKTDQDDGRGSR